MLTCSFSFQHKEHLCMNSSVQSPVLPTADSIWFDHCRQLNKSVSFHLLFRPSGFDRQRVLQKMRVVVLFVHAALCSRSPDIVISMNMVMEEGRGVFCMIVICAQQQKPSHTEPLQTTATCSSLLGRQSAQCWEHMGCEAPHVNPIPNQIQF